MPYCKEAFLSGKQPSAVNIGTGEKKNEKKEDFNFILPCNIFILVPFISCLFVFVLIFGFVLFFFSFSPVHNVIFILSSHIYSS